MLAQTKAQGVTKTVAEHLVDFLERRDVRHVFGLCGHTNIAVLAAMADSPIDFVTVRHEQIASHAADGYARVTGKPGICEGPSGGGATYILPGLVEANESSIPVLAITSDVSTASRGRYPLTELDQQALFGRNGLHFAAPEWDGAGLDTLALGCRQGDHELALAAQHHAGVDLQDELREHVAVKIGGIAKPEEVLFAGDAKDRRGAHRILKSAMENWASLWILYRRCSFNFGIKQL